MSGTLEFHKLEETWNTWGEAEQKTLPSVSERENGPLHVCAAKTVDGILSQLHSLSLPAVGHKSQLLPGATRCRCNNLHLSAFHKTAVRQRTRLSLPPGFFFATIFLLETLYNWEVIQSKLNLYWHVENREQLVNGLRAANNGVP